jgi:hypothetical protein
MHRYQVFLVFSLSSSADMSLDSAKTALGSRLAQEVGLARAQGGLLEGVDG